MSNRTSGNFSTFLTCELILRVVKKVDRGIFLDFMKFFQKILRYFRVEACPVYRYLVSRACYPVLYHSWIQHLFKSLNPTNKQISWPPLFLPCVIHALISLKNIYTFNPFPKFICTLFFSLFACWI